VKSVLPRISRRAFLGALAAAVGAGAAWRVSLEVARPGGSVASAGPSRADLATDVRAEFLRAYRAYRRLAAEHDELRPVSGTGSDFFAPGHPVGLTTIESLDTLYLMELDDELSEGVAFVANELSFDIDAPVQVFEAVIRLVGGLLSGYHATQDARVLSKARDLADRLMPAFDTSPTGMPYRYVNLRSAEVSERTNLLAEIGTCIAEFGDLSRLTGDERYVRAARRAQQAVVERRSSLDLVGTALDVETGRWTDRRATINPPVDSFFEYLWDGWDLLSDEAERNWYRTLTDAIVGRLSVELDGRLWFASVDYETGARETVEQSFLAAFYPGLLGRSGYLEVGRRYHDSWKAALESGYRVLPEGLDPDGYRATQAGNQLRPEYVDSCFNLWLQTGEEVYVDRAAEYYENMKAASRVENGYTILTDVTTRPEAQGDLTPAYWFSENMKYYWLMFGRARRFDYANNYLTTEGNVLRGLLPPEGT
jgi:mannosyl-oligosaccharide alpha-1,2-mannosidase